MRNTGMAIVLSLLCWPTASLFGQTAAPAGLPLCSPEWCQFITRQLAINDSQRHGPDCGSTEWQAAVEKKLGLTGQGDVPPRQGKSWCRHIDQLVKNDGISSVGPKVAATRADGPSFSCQKTAPGTLAAMICADPELSALDRQLASVYAAARSKAVNEHPPLLQAMQRGWIKGRDDCWKNDDERRCVQQAYQLRITELQARYRLVSFAGPIRLRCDDQPGSELVVTYFHTEPPTLIAERGDSDSLMYLEPSASGTRYVGRNEMYWEKGQQATLVWGYQAPPIQCQKDP